MLVLSHILYPKNYVLAPLITVYYELSYASERIVLVIKSVEATCLEVVFTKALFFICRYLRYKNTGGHPDIPGHRDFTCGPTSGATA
ncbi:MAG: hypothetical protein JSV82_09660 [Planctomycetota bacterium]|nr:MAG: hypothetical protein JSV82_09660 [Planctomycetota bacterium]